MTKQVIITTAIIILVMLAFMVSGAIGYNARGYIAGGGEYLIIPLFLYLVFAVKDAERR